MLAIVFAGARLVLVTAQLGDGFGAVFDGSTLSLAWSAVGPSTIAIVGGSLAIMAAGPARSPVLAALGALASAVSFGLTGHTLAVSEPGVAPAAAAIHVFIAGYWVAAPLTLWPSASLSDQELHGRLNRFSNLAITAIPILLLIGIWLAWRLAGGVEAVLGSLYGQVLLAKLAVSLAALGAGVFNKQVVTELVLSDAVRARRLLSRTLAVEASLFVIAILAVSVATTLVSPPE
jgi:putative copper export protein